MAIMGLTEEFAEARAWVATSMDLDQDVDVNLFECTIRILGGLLSTYHITNDELFLTKAVDLGRRLLPAFNDHSGIPFSDVNLRTHHAHGPQWNPLSSTSEVSSIQLEFKDLSFLTGDPVFAEKVTRVMNQIESQPKRDGLVLNFIDPNSGTFSGFLYSLGSRADSYYEYLLKQYLQTGKTEDMYKRMYLEAVGGILKHLVKVSLSSLFFLGLSSFLIFWCLLLLFFCPVHFVSVFLRPCILPALLDFLFQAFRAEQARFPR
eukprot:m.540161 g.540161  ORF g.540161 m.540161 type:complete len:262 (-) comp57641_c0_seq12:733-1518(-)